MGKWTPSTIVGTILMLFGLVPFVLWVLDLIDVLHPEKQVIETWPVILMTVFATGLGGMLYKGKGASIGESFLSWFGKRE